MHNVLIEGLDRYTNYYYQVTTGGAESGVNMFKTPHLLLIMKISDLLQLAICKKVMQIQMFLTR